MARPLRSFAVPVFCTLAVILFADGGFYYVERINRDRQSRSLSSSKILGLAASQYAQDHKEHYPDAGRWEQDLAPYLASDAAGFGDAVHPAPPLWGTPRRFSLNPALSGKSITQIAEPGNV